MAPRPPTASPESPRSDGPPPGPGATRRERLEALRDRLVGLNHHSRTLRLSRCTKSGAFDLSHLQQERPAAFTALVDVLGRRDDAEVELIEQRPTDEEGAVIERSLASLAAKARDAWLETGVWDLAVGWPFLEGRGADGTWIRAPLLIYPARLQLVTKGRYHWRLALGGLPYLNPALPPTLSRLAGCELTWEQLLANDDDRVFAADEPTWAGIDHTLRAAGVPLAPAGALASALSRVLPRSADQIGGLPVARFHLDNLMVLGRFPPSGSSVVADFDALLDGPLDDTTLGRAADLLSVDEPLDPTLGGAWGGARELSAQVLQHLPLPSDSSQDRVLAWSQGAGGRGLVVQGPPGTGKSQLIANLVAASLAAGQRVLVVCEKRAALDVVAARLAGVGLGEPLAVVHDVSADRARLCRALVETIERAIGDQDDAPPAVPDNVVLGRMRTRLEMTQQAYDALTAAPDGQLDLATLYLRRLADPPRPLPDLAGAGADVSERDAHDYLPRLEAFASTCRALAAPHPLHQRTDFGSFVDADLLRHHAFIETWLGELRGLERAGAHLTERQRDELRPAFDTAATVLELLDRGDAARQHRFALFWGWTGGHAMTGEWSQVLGRLQSARASLADAPRELMTVEPAELRGWIDSFGRLTSLRLRWYRWALPGFWRLRALVGHVQERCPSFVGRWPLVVSAGQPEAPLTAVARDALGWQQLNADMPLDNPFLDFGFQGEVAEIDAAIESLTSHTDLVRAVHRLREALIPFGGPFRAVTAFVQGSDLADEPFIRAALAEYRAQRAFAALTNRLDDAEGALDAGILGQLRERLDLARRGHIGEAVAHAQELEAAWVDAPEAARIDRLLADEPAWARRFLCRWNPPTANLQRSGQDAVSALERDWIATRLGGRSRAFVEAALVEDALLDELAADLAGVQAFASARIVGLYRQRIHTLLGDEGRARRCRLLLSEARKRRRRLTLRQLAERFFDDSLAALRPVWLCSPDSVASLFPLQRDLFDLVIFDEASQCPVESVLPAFVRARRVLIAGDEQQMPPSRFFAASHGVDDEDGDESALLRTESLLGLARIAYPSTTLTWHYRSRHESLIAFSSRTFYGGRLVTAPRPDPPSAPEVEGLHWHRVAGAWEDRCNAVEAAAVVDRVVDLICARGPDGVPPSVGVVTFNLQQAELIERLLQERTADDQRCRDALDRDAGRPPSDQLFVRNLENVQGDERDVIVFSIGYGPSPDDGAIHARFGPVGQRGGEKRLNVAITRARIGVHIVASFDPSQLDVSGTKNPGPKLLLAYLAYARACAQGDAVQAAGALDRAAAVVGAQADDHDPVARQRSATEDQAIAWVAGQLRARGLNVAERVGMARRKIDLAVARDPGGRPIAVDLSLFLSESDPLARDVYMRSYWRRLGWRVLRVTAGMCADDGEAALARVETAIAASDGQEV